MDDYLTAIDFGTGRVALAIGEKTASTVKVEFYREAPVTGVRGGEINNEAKVSEVLGKLIEEAQDETGLKINEAVISVSGRIVNSSLPHLKFKRIEADRQIVAGELNKITRQQFNKEPSPEEKIYEVIPQRFNVGDVIGISAEEVPGMRGPIIEGDFLFLSGKKSLLANRLDVMNRCSVKVSKAILSPIAAARAVLSEQEMENGAVLVDIGKGNTEIVIVKDYLVRAMYVVPFGGESITLDIKKVANISSKWAEKVKCSHGCCLKEYTPENKKLVLKGEDGCCEGEIELSLLSAIIEARVSEIMDAVKYLIDNSSYNGKLPGGVVLTGGSCYLSNIQELAKALLGMKVRLAAPRFITGDSVDECRDMNASVAVGLLMEGFSRKLSSAPRIEIQQESEPGKKTGATRHPGILSGLFGGSREDAGTRNGSSEEDSSQAEIARRKEEASRQKEEEARRKKEEKERKLEEKRLKNEQKRLQREKQGGGSFIGSIFDQVDDRA